MRRIYPNYLKGRRKALSEGCKAQSKQVEVETPWLERRESCLKVVLEQRKIPNSTVPDNCKEGKKPSSGSNSDAVESTWRLWAGQKALPGSGASGPSGTPLAGPAGTCSCGQLLNNRASFLLFRRLSFRFENQIPLFFEKKDDPLIFNFNATFLHLSPSSFTRPLIPLFKTFPLSFLFIYSRGTPVSFWNLSTLSYCFKMKTCET